MLNQLLARANYQNELTKSVTSEYENGENEDAIALVACGFCRVCPRSRVCKSFPFSLFFSLSAVRVRWGPGRVRFV